MTIMEEIISINSQELSEDYVNRIQNLCRLCLLQSKELDLHSDSYLPDKKWIDILINVTNNNYMENNNEYPQGICEECSSKLVLFYKFKQKVATSYNTLKNIFKNCVFNQNLEENESKISSENINDYVTYIKSDLIEEVNFSEDEDLEHIQDIPYNNISYDTDKEIETIDDQKVEEHNLEEIQIDGDNDSSDKEIICYLEVEQEEKIDDEKYMHDEQELFLNDSIYEHDIENENGRFIESININNVRKKGKNKNIQCEICGAKFTRNSSLRQHDTVHSLEKKFECDLCHKRFTRRAHLDIHMLIHSNIRPHSCDVCGRAFTKSGDLKRHQKIHSNVFEYICNICNKEFKRKEYLTTHINSHYGVKPYKCKYCNKCYQSLSGLLKHTKSVHTFKENV